MDLNSNHLSLGGDNVPPGGSMPYSTIRYYTAWEHPPSPPLVGLEGFVPPERSGESS